MSPGLDLQRAIERGGSEPRVDSGIGDLADLLDEVVDEIHRYVALPSPEYAEAVALWIAATHCQPVLHHATRLVITSPEKRCGKSRLLDVVEALAHKPLVSANASVPALFRSISGDDPPTILLDEADTIFGAKAGKEGAEDLRGLLNAGHGRNRPVIRCVGPHQTPTPFPSFAMAALAAIRDLPDTIEDRAVVVRMRRRHPDEHVDPYRIRRDGERLHRLRERLAEAMADAQGRIEFAEPDLPVEDREADCWEPLVAVADVAGGEWPGRARHACEAICAATSDEENLDVKLLADLRDVWADDDGSVLASATLVGRLRALEESPWGRFDLDAAGLARRLRSFEVRSQRVPPGGPRRFPGSRLQAGGPGGSLGALPANPRRGPAPAPPVTARHRVTGRAEPQVRGPFRW